MLITQVHVGMVIEARYPLTGRVVSGTVAAVYTRSNEPYAIITKGGDGRHDVAINTDTWVVRDLTNIRVTRSM